jgi:phage repressor protein C with HTH and peptisase S24 domain
MTDQIPVATLLKRLREATSPKLSVRATAEALEIPASSYAFYEDPNGFKKAFLPVPLARQLAQIFGANGIERRDVLALAGFDEQHAPESEADQLAQQLDAVMLDEIEVGYSMGGGTDVSDYPIVRQVPFSREWLASLTSAPASQLFVARGDGDSMMPTLLDQDIVIIDRSQRAVKHQDRIWAVSYGGFSMIKRIRMLPDGSMQINSDNPAVSPIQAFDGEAFLVGRVIAIVRRI